MSAIFLDTNYFISLLEPRGIAQLEQYEGEALFISALSIHILAYVYKRKMPDQQLAQISDYYTVVALTGEIALRAAQGPTADFEDNLQLHSAVAAGCRHFLTQDKKLLKQRYFGSLEILAAVAP